METAPDNAVERVQDFPVPVGELWSAVSDEAQLATWLGDELELEVRPGGSGRIVDDGEVRRVVVEDLVDGERLSFTWWTEHLDQRRPGATVAGPPRGTEGRRLRTPSYCSMMTDRWLTPSKRKRPIWARRV